MPHSHESPPKRAAAALRSASSRPVVPSNPASGAPKDASPPLRASAELAASTGTALHIVTSRDQRQMAVTCPEANLAIDSRDVKRAASFVGRQAAARRGGPAGAARVRLSLSLLGDEPAGRPAPPGGRRGAVAAPQRGAAIGARKMLDVWIASSSATSSRRRTCSRTACRAAGASTAPAASRLHALRRARRGLARRGVELQTVVVTFAAGHLLRDARTLGGARARPPASSAHATDADGSESAHTRPQRTRSGRRCTFPAAACATAAARAPRRLLLSVDDDALPPRSTGGGAARRRCVADPLGGDEIHGGGPAARLRRRCEPRRRRERGADSMECRRPAAQVVLFAHFRSPPAIGAADAFIGGGLAAYAATAHSSGFQRRHAALPARRAARRRRIRRLCFTGLKGRPSSAAIAATFATPAEDASTSSRPSA